MAYISAENLCKHYRIKKKSEKGKFKRNIEIIKAIDNISFSVEKGDIVGYVGPNGAGKSTTIKLLSGILRPDEGTCTVSQEIPWKNRKKYVKNIGVLFGQKSQLLWDLPVTDTFEMLRCIYGMTKEAYKESLLYLSNQLDLEPLLGQPVRQMSLGQRMRCEFAATFLHNPELVFLDEPTIGIDIEMKERIYHFIKSINKEKDVTIFITSHDIDDIQALCNRIIIVNKGKLYYDGTVSELCNGGYMEQKINIELADNSELLIAGESRMKKIGERKYCVYVKEKEQVGKVMADIVRNNHILSLYAERADLEEILLKIYKSLKDK